MQSCAPVWAQCGGKNHNGPTCCTSGSTCVYKSEWYSQCRPGGSAPSPSPTPTATPATPSSTPSGGCASVWQQCGGKNHNGPTCCESGSTCIATSEWYSQCKPGSAALTDAPTAAPTDGPTAAPTDAPTAAPTDAPTGQSQFGVISNTGFPYFSSDANWNGYGSSNGCGFMAGGVSSSIDHTHTDMRVGVAMHAAHGNTMMANGYGAKCGVCIKLTGAPEQWTADLVEKYGNNAKAGWSKVVKVVDVLNPGYLTDGSPSTVEHLDFMFDVPAGTLASGKIPVSWEEVPCAEHGLEDWTYLFQTNDGCAANWDQCGGAGFSGPTCCQPGYTCQYETDSYSQCVQA